MLRKKYLAHKILFVCLLICGFLSQKLWATEPAKINNKITGITTTQKTPQDVTKQTPKDWNFIVYIAGNNDLYRFSIANLKQMLKIGSTDTVNIIVQFDEYLKREVTRYYVEQGNLVIADTKSDSLIATSGTPESLYDFVKWSVTNYKAKHQAVVLWNHGYGIKDPNIWGRAHMLERDKLFTFNSHIGLLELNRKHITKTETELKSTLEDRGIAFNDTAEEYLTNQDLSNTLEKISKEVLGNKKIDILFMDACLMGMVEIGSQIKNYVNYMVASEEVEAGSGYNYTYLLSPFQTGTLSVADFARHAIWAYEEEYKLESADYTQSAIALQDFEKLENNIRDMGKTLIQIIEKDTSSNFFAILKEIRLKSLYTTEFYDPEYIDFTHFYKSLLELMTKRDITRTVSRDTATLIKKVNTLTQEGLNMLQNYIIKNTAGVNLDQAYGLAFYFPTQRVHTSYYKTMFDKKTEWSKFLTAFIRKLKYS
ncbi:MAG: clostripain-related cysteine peptidase [bacterium]